MSGVDPATPRQCIVLTRFTHLPPFEHRMLRTRQSRECKLVCAAPVRCIIPSFYLHVSRVLLDDSAASTLPAAVRYSQPERGGGARRSRCGGGRLVDLARRAALLRPDRRRDHVLR
eukprot:932897-Pleurochrysis_carterae.AAC.2